MHNNFTHNTALKLVCVLFELNDARVKFMSDIDLDRSAEALSGMPVLSFKNVQVKPINSGLQLHEIALRAIPTKDDAYEMVGYFCTAKIDVAREILDRQDYQRGIQLFDMDVLMKESGQLTWQSVT